MRVLHYWKQLCNSQTVQHWSLFGIMEHQLFLLIAMFLTDNSSGNPVFSCMNVYEKHETMLYLFICWAAIRFYLCTSITIITIPKISAEKLNINLYHLFSFSSEYSKYLFDSTTIALNAYQFVV